MRTFVLVPGCWVSGWAWHPVARYLEELGHRVVVPGLPGLAYGDDPRTVSLRDATDALVSQLERHDVSDVVLVAHDWSGYPVTAAANKVPDRVAQVTFWSAFVPVAGESLLDAVPTDDREMLLGRAEEAGGHSVLVPLERWRTSFVAPSPAPVQELTYQLLRAHPIAYMADALSADEAALPDAAIAYITATDDLSLAPGDEWWAPKYSARAGVEPTSFEGCHAAHLLDPARVGDQLIATSKD